VRFLKKSLLAAEEYSPSEKPLVPSLNASKVTLPGFAGGEYFPLPASKGPAFPFPLTLGGYPTFPANFAQEQGLSPNIKDAPERKTLRCAQSSFFSNPTKSI
jgi:hypothetical protein